MLLACFSITASAQVKAGDVVSGQVWDDFDPLMMCNVVEIDHNKRIVAHGTTDINGNFSFKIVNPKNKIRISYIGCQTVELPITKKSFGKIVLKSNTTLKEVTVKAVRKSQSTGLAIPMTEISTASQTIDMKEFEGIPMTSVDEALQGRVAGLDIVANSGDLGAGTTIRLRGASTINGNQNPLIVVNGNPLETSENIDNSYNEEKFAELLQVNPDDIESITVLKDAAAQAIWGTKGANGVIEIKTKRGARGKTKVRYNYRFTGNWIYKRYKLLNGDDYTMYMKEAYYNPRLETGFSNNASPDYMPEIAYNKAWSEYNMFNDNTDWVDEVTKFGMLHSHNISLTGGGERATFRVSGGYDQQSNYIIAQEMDRFTTNVALDYTVSDRIKVTTNFDFLYMDRDYHNTGGVIGQAQIKMPNLSVYREDENGNDTGEYYTMNRYISQATGMYAASTKLLDQYNIPNPLAVAYNSTDRTRQLTLRPEFIFRYEILGTQPDQHRLQYEGQIRFDINSSDYDYYMPGWVSSAGMYNQNGDPLAYNSSRSSSSKSHSMSTRHILTYTPHFNREGHGLMLMARYDYGQSDGSSQNTGRNMMPTTNDITSTLAGGIINGFGSSAWQNKWQNVTFQAHYSYKGRYTITGVLRGDCTNAFGPDRPWGFFPALSGRWNISKEPFMEKVKWLSMLSIRPSWGYSGGTPGGEQWRSYYGGGPSYLGKASTVPLNIRLSGLQWETKQSFQVGFDFGFFDDKITGNVDIYTATIKDLLWKNNSYRIPSSSGYGAFAVYNDGKMRNQGWEFNINGNRLLKKGKFSMDFNVSFANNRNRILEMDETLLANTNREFDYTPGAGYLYRVQLNNPLNSIYGFRYKGVYAYSEYSEKEVPGISGPNSPVVRNAAGEPVFDSTGAPKMMVYDYGGARQYLFVGGDAIYEDINHDGQINELDIVYLGSSLPKFTGGFGTRFHYGGWELNLQFNFRAGVKVINQARRNLENMNNNNNQSIAVNWRWHNEGDVALLPRAATANTNFDTYNYLPSDRFVEDASFVRLNYAQLSYTFDKKLLKDLGLSQLRLNFTLNNAFCLTKYSGLDPEHAASGFSPAVDSDTNPRSRSFTFGLSVSF